jgi:hypothetical protein
LAESRLFNRLRRIQIKKSAWPRLAFEVVGPRLTRFRCLYLLFSPGGAWVPSEKSVPRLRGTAKDLLAATCTGRERSSLANGLLWRGPSVRGTGDGRLQGPVIDAPPRRIPIRPLPVSDFVFGCAHPPQSRRQAPLSPLTHRHHDVMMSMRATNTTLAWPRRVGGWFVQDYERSVQQSRQIPTGGPDRREELSGRACWPQREGKGRYASRFQRR